MNSRKTSKLMTILFGGLLLAVQAMAQQRTVMGMVSDKLGEPLPGVNVVIKGTTTGTVTSVDGKYRLNVPPSAKVLRFSFVGMKPLELSIPAQGGTLNAVLEDESMGLDEVVVIGYGTTTKRDLTGAVSSMSAKEIASTPVTDVTQALAGRLAGVQVTTLDGGIDSDVKIRVRGGGSITQDNSPLYLVDGFPVDNLKDISPNDIASIDVLKDASSTAIYGARGANGVILITTKEAKAGKTTVSYNMYYQWRTVPKFLNTLSTYEYVMWQYELLSAVSASAFSPSSFANKYGEMDELSIWKNVRGNDQQRDLYGRWRTSQSHNVSINGGTKDTRIALSYSFAKEEGAQINSNLDRHNISLRFNHNISPQIALNSTIRYANTFLKGSQGQDVSKSVICYPRTRGFSSLVENLEDDPDVVSQSNTFIPPSVQAEQTYQRQARESIDANAQLAWTPLKGLRISSDLSGRISTSKTQKHWGPITSTARSSINGNPVAEIVMTESPRWKSTSIAQYSNTWLKKHKFDALLGFEALSEGSYSLKVTSRNFAKELSAEKALANMTMGSQEFAEVNQGADNRLLSYFGRANYGFDGKYLLTITLRTDASTKFAPENRWGFFPSGAVAWRMSDESFMKQVKAISNMKLRFSYGIAGNNRISSDMWRSTFSYSTSNSYGYNDNVNTYLAPASNILFNPDIKWESTYTRNLGLDFGFFKQRLSGSLEFYWNTTKDLLIQSIIPTSNGYKNVMKNVGQTSNTGVELTLNADIARTKEFYINATFIFGTNKNNVDALDPSVPYSTISSGWQFTVKPTDDYYLEVGKPIGLMRGFVADGFYTVEDFDWLPNGNHILKRGIANSQRITSSAPSGSSKYYDQDGNVKAGGPAVGSLKLKKLTPIDPNNTESMFINDKEDATVIGNASPLFTGGFNLQAGWRGFDVATQFNFVVGNKIYNANKIYTTSYGNQNSGYNLTAEMDLAHRFRQVDDNGVKMTTAEQFAELNKDATIWSPGMTSHPFTTWAVEDGSFLRLSTLTIGYTLPAHLTKRVLVSSLRFYITGSNLFCLTKYSGYDPEVDGRRTTPLTPGVDYNAMPKLRGFTAGFNISF